MDLAFWRDIAIVFLALETVLLVGLLLAAAYFAVRGLDIAHRWLPKLLLRGQTISHTVRDQAAQTSDRVAAPLVGVQRAVAKTKTIVRGLVPGGRRKRPTTAPTGHSSPFKTP